MKDALNANQFLQHLMSHQREIYGFIYGMVPNPHDADDLFQETVTRMWAKFNTFDPDTDFSAWGITIARYTIMSARKRFALRKRIFSENLQDLLLQQAEQIFTGFDRRVDALKQCVNKLNDRDYELIRLRYEEEIPVKTIANKAGRSLQSVYKRMARIHNLLSNCVRRTMNREELA